MRFAAPLKTRDSQGAPKGVTNQGNGQEAHNENDQVGIRGVVDWHRYTRSVEAVVECSRGDGWELVAILPSTDDGPYAVICKRPKR